MGLQAPKFETINDDVNLGSLTFVNEEFEDLSSLS